MELRQLRHFVVLAEEVHFGRASERLCITQPALSASILRLEEEFAIRLFERDSKSVRITLAGELLLKYAREMLNHAERTKSFSKALSAGRLGRIEVGITGPVVYSGVSEVIKNCRAAFPDIQIVIREITSQKQVELLRASRLDAGFVEFPLPPSGLEFIELFEDRFAVCLPADHRFATRKKIDIAELRDERFVMQPREQVPSVYDQLVGLCATAGFQPQVAFESSHAVSSVTIVARGFGVALVPESLASVGISGVVFVPLDRELPRRSGYLVWSATRQAPGLEALIASVREFVEVMKQSGQSMREPRSRSR